MRAPLSDLPIVVDRVSLKVGSTVILDRLGLTINAGAPTFIVGPNGSGKSTLLRLCMGLIMLRRTVAANVAYGLAHANYPRERRRERLEELLDRVRLAELAKRPARRLSGGEQQRLALARALARDPDLLLLDEPTANLDPAATRAVEEIIRMAAQSGIKIVMASHDLGQVRRLAGDVVFLVRGTLCEQGSVGDFLDHPSTAKAAAFIRGDLVF
jgi:tungstate transport system ATP-binding protein